MTERPRTPRAAIDRRLAVACLVLLGAALSACAGLGPGGGSPSPTDRLGRIDHPTGPSTVILRLDEGGGFVAPSFFVTQAPAFSLYGDGTAIFRDASAPPPPASDEVIRSVPFQVLRLSEAEIQSILAYAVGPGGLTRARAQYQLPVADAPTTTFTIDAGGLMRTVSVNGLGTGADAGADAAVLTALANLRARLMGFGASVDGETRWDPERYRGILMEPVEGGFTGQAMAWPWGSIRPANFTPPADPGMARWPTRLLSPAEVSDLGLDDLEGGATGILLARPGDDPPGEPYVFAVRPLLPDEPR